MQHDRAASRIVVIWRNAKNQVEEYPCDLQYIPQVGDLVFLSTVRDENGNFLELPQGGKRTERHLTNGTVSSVDHTIREVGQREDQRSWIQEIHITIRKDHVDE